MRNWNKINRNQPKINVIQRAQKSKPSPYRQLNFSRWLKVNRKKHRNCETFSQTSVNKGKAGVTKQLPHASMTLAHPLGIINSLNAAVENEKFPPNRSLLKRESFDAYKQQKKSSGEFHRIGRDLCVSVNKCWLTVFRSLFLCFSIVDHVREPQYSSWCRGRRLLVIGCACEVINGFFE